MSVTDHVADILDKPVRNLDDPPSLAKSGRRILESPRLVEED